MSVKTIKFLNKTKNITNNQITYMKGAEILQKAFWRICHEDIIISISKKFRAISISHFIAIICSIRNKRNKELLAKYLYYWRYISNPPKYNKEEIKSKLKLIILRKEKNNIKYLTKYFNIWKYKKQINPELHNDFCYFLKNDCDKNILISKRQLIKNLCLYYINKQGKKFSKLNLKKIFEKYILYKLVQTLKPIMTTIKIKKLIIITKEFKTSTKNNYLLKIIRKWRFATFVNNLTKKKLELIFNNMHTSYLEMANEVFNTPQSISMKELNSISEYNEQKDLCFKTNSFLIKELGLNSETSCNKFIEQFKLLKMN